MVETASYTRAFEHGTMNGKLGWIERELEEFYYTSESTISSGEWELQSGTGYWEQETSYGDFANGSLSVTNNNDNTTTTFKEAWKQLYGNSELIDYTVEDNEWTIDDETENVVDLLEYIYNDDDSATIPSNYRTIIVDNQTYDDFEDYFDNVTQTNNFINTQQVEENDIEQTTTYSTTESNDSPQNSTSAYDALIPVDDNWYSGGTKTVDPDAPWSEDGVIITFKNLYKNDEKALRALLLVTSIYTIQQTNSNIWSEWSVDHQNKIIYITGSSYYSQRSNANAAAELYQILSDEFYQISGMAESWEGWFWRETKGAFQIVLGGVAIGGGALLWAAPEPTTLTKIGGTGAITVGADTIVNGAGQMWSRSGGISPIREMAGLYGRTVAGPEGEAQSRYWMGWSLFLFDIAGAAGVTKIGNVPLRELPAATKTALQDVYLLIRSKNKSQIEKFEGITFQKVHARHNIEEVVDSTRVKTPDVPKTDRSFLWQMNDRTESGQLIHQMFGENLPKNFKTFDIYDSTTRRAISIETLDTSMPSYQSVSNIVSTVKKKINDVVDFDEYSRVLNNGKKFVLTSDEIDERVFHLVVPHGTTNVQRQAFHILEEYAESKNVIFKITELY
jgi:hypothetical protein